jgi:hypothetical protein
MATNARMSLAALALNAKSRRSTRSVDSRYQATGSRAVVVPAYNMSPATVQNQS